MNPQHLRFSARIKFALRTRVSIPPLVNQTSIFTARKNIATLDLNAVRGFATTPRRDLYEVLGVSKSTSQADIKKAYYTLVKKLHPDVNKDDPKAASKFQDVQNAYEILSDEQKRGAYDRFGHAGVDQAAAAEEAAANGGPGGMPFGNNGDFVDAEELFSRIFGGMGGGMRGGQRGAPQRGSDVQAGITIAFMDAVNGCTRSLTTPVMCRCESCKGTGSNDGKDPVQCTTCKGSGQQTMQNGMYTVLTTCRKCSGAGTIIKNPCRLCSGSGTVRKPKTVTVTVPAGVDTGMNLRLAGEGDAGEQGAPSGHLYVRISIEPDDFFERSGTDVHIRVPIHFSLAALGGEVPVPTLKGEVQLKVPPGSQPGDKLVLRGKGIKSLSSGTIGNQIVHLEVEVPSLSSLSSRQKELLQQLREEDLLQAAKKTKGNEKGSANSWSQKLGRILNRIIGKKDSG
jgi:molecular chaperone DnaJ